METEPIIFCLTTIQCVPGGAAAVVEQVEKSTSAQTSVLVGCWVSEIGKLNEVVVLRRFPPGQTAEPELLSLDGRHAPEGNAPVLFVDHGLFRAFPGIEVLEEGNFGKFYEIRTYCLKPAIEALGETVAAWQAAIPERVALSPLAVVMHALTGPKRIVHIWPFKTLDERQAVRAEAFKKGWWPPRGTLQWMESAASSVYLPVPYSPLH